MAILTPAANRRKSTAEKRPFYISGAAIFGDDGSRNGEFRRISATDERPQNSPENPEMGKNGNFGTDANGDRLAALEREALALRLNLARVCRLADAAMRRLTPEQRREALAESTGGKA